MIPTTTGRRPASDAEGVSGPVAELKPIEAIRPNRQKVRGDVDTRKLRIPEHLHRHTGCEIAEVELDRLNASAEIGHTQHDVGLMTPEVGEDLVVGRLQELDAATSEDLEQAPEPNHVAHPVQQPGRLT